MIVLPIIRNLGGLKKKIRPKRPTKIDRNDPGPKRPWPKRPRAEMTGPKRPGTYELMRFQDIRKNSAHNSHF